MHNADPTCEHIVAALVRAKELVARRDLDVIAALAEATTTAQCHGIQGFKVFRDTRTAVEKVVGRALAQYVHTADRAATLRALDTAITNTQKEGGS